MRPRAEHLKREGAGDVARLETSFPEAVIFSYSVWIRKLLLDSQCRGTLKDKEP